MGERVNGRRDLLQSGARLGNAALHRRWAWFPCKRLQPQGQHGQLLTDIIVELTRDSRALGFLHGNQFRGELTQRGLHPPLRARVPARADVARDAAVGRILRHGAAG